MNKTVKFDYHIPASCRENNNNEDDDDEKSTKRKNIENLSQILTKVKFLS